MQRRAFAIYIGHIPADSADVQLESSFECDYNFQIRKRYIAFVKHGEKNILVVSCIDAADNAITKWYDLVNNEFEISFRKVSKVKCFQLQYISEICNVDLS